MNKYVMMVLALAAILTGLKNLSASSYPPFAPIVLHVQPETQKANEGKTAAFYVMADGEGPLQFQWQCNGKNIPGANGKILKIASVKGADAGAYTCQIKNKFGEIVTQSMVLSVADNVKETYHIQDASKSKIATAAKP